MSTDYDIDLAQIGHIPGTGDTLEARPVGLFFDDQPDDMTMEVVDVKIEDVAPSDMPRSSSHEIPEQADSDETVDQYIRATLEGEDGETYEQTAWASELRKQWAADEDKIEKAVEADMAWLLTEAQTLEAWEGTAPTDVGIFDLGDQTATTLLLEQVRSDKRSDELGNHAHDYWQTLASRWRRDRLDVDDLRSGEGQ